MVATLDIKAFKWVIPSAARVTVVDTVFHKRGDVNWNGKIDMEDINRIAAAYGSRPGSSKWDPECDLNGDGIIDIFDVATAARHFGETAPEYTTPFSVQVEAGRCVVKGVLNNLELTHDWTVAEGATSRVIFEFNPVTGGRVIVAPMILTVGVSAKRVGKAVTHPRVPTIKTY